MKNRADEYLEEHHVDSITPNVELFAKGYGSEGGYGYVKLSQYMNDFAQTLINEGDLQPRSESDAVEFLKWADEMSVKYDRSREKTPTWMYSAEKMYKKFKDK